MTDRDRFRVHVFNLLIDNVVGGLTQRFQSLDLLCQKFSFLWTYDKMENDALHSAANSLAEEYAVDLDADMLSAEVINLKSIHKDNFDMIDGIITPIKVLNELYRLDLGEIFPEVMTALKIFLTIPVTVASGERSFSQLKLVKSDIRSTMTQDRLNSLATLNINWKIARSLDFKDIVSHYAKKQARGSPNFF